MDKAMNGLVREVAESYGTDADLIEDLLAYEQTRAHREKRRGAKDYLRAVIDKVYGSDNASSYIADRI